MNKLQYGVLAILMVAILLVILYKKADQEFFDKIEKTQWNKVYVDKWVDKLNDKSLSTQFYDKKRVCVVCYDDRKTIDYIDKLKIINKSYCDKHEYSFIFYDSYQNLETKYPPYWLKIKIVLDILKNNQYDYVMWIDSDACFYNLTVKIENIFATFGEDMVFVMSSDRTDGLVGSRGIFNAGVWIVNNNSLGLEFMEEWLDKYNEKEWFMVKDKWVCKQCFYDVCKQCIWAGKSYEQGSCDTLLTNKKYENKVIFLDPTILQGIIPHLYTFVLHFYGNYKSHINILV